MSGNGDLNIGQSAHATLTFDDGQGHPSQPPVNLAYDAAPPGIVSISADATGVVVTGLSAGSYTVHATADNCQPASISGVVALPLASHLALAWD